MRCVPLNLGNWASLKYVIETKTVKRVEQGNDVTQVLSYIMVFICCVSSDRGRVRKTVDLFSWQFLLADE